MSNSLNPDQALSFVRPMLGPNCLQRLSADDKKWPLAGKELILSMPSAKSEDNKLIFSYFSQKTEFYANCLLSRQLICMKHQSLLSLKNISKCCLVKFLSSMQSFNSFPASGDLSSADNLCKQFGPRSGLTKCRA